MKKLLIIALFSMLPLLSSAQAMIGYSYNEIWDHWDDQDCRREGKVSKQGVQYISISTEYMVIGYYFDENYVCDQVYIFPVDISGVNSFVERYNGKYTIIDDTHWKAYFPETYCTISLIYKKGLSLPFFYWE